jgi:hypothetical protein
LKQDRLGIDTEKVEGNGGVVCRRALVNPGESDGCDWSAGAWASGRRAA